MPDPARIAQAREVRARHEASLLALPGVVGVGIGLTPDGADVAIQVYLADPVDAALQALPDDLEGVPVVPVVTGSFEAR